MWLKLVGQPQRFFARGLSGRGCLNRAIVCWQFLCTVLSSKVASQDGAILSRAKNTCFGNPLIFSLKVASPDMATLPTVNPFWQTLRFLVKGRPIKRTVSILDYSEGFLASLAFALQKVASQDSPEGCISGQTVSIAGETPTFSFRRWPL